MPCRSPLQAYQLVSGDVVFKERGDVYRTLQLPCGRCILCRLERSRQWAMRCMHEASLHKENAFLTLTYDDEHVPLSGSLDHRHVQLFLKRLRKALNGRDIRYYMCGEYGETTFRPHYHICLFNYQFPDCKHYSGDGETSLYTSAVLDGIWGLGECKVGALTFQSAAYVARYCLSVRSGNSDDVAAWYAGIALANGVPGPLEPEYAAMSRRPAIGKRWLELYEMDVYPHDYVVVNGKKVKPPKFYDKIFSSENPLTFEEIQAQRELDAAERRDDNTPERIEVKARVAKAREVFFSKRS